ncbi:P-type H+-ATPase, putative [Bodo saltans]|uniref:Plasma membrane ATPase n=2 Tax=Bodo saltans TaxID=75058 RepID=A0A0S4IVK7_BODSA|nr:P-type H+-ATPase, putative [Bodo saltans]|eukprot:CUF89536.1 P-type H+-ATPase, putative [Bodo saltans]
MDNDAPLLPPSHGLTTAEAERLLAIHGRNELPEKSTPGWVIFVRCLWGPMPIAIWIAVIIEFALQNWPDGGILLFIQFANATIGWYETTKAGDAVAALRSSLKPLATAFRDGKWQNIDAGGIVPGDLVKLASGSAVPADCSINEGQIDVDEAALTGESLPVTMSTEHMPKMGSTVVRGEVDGTVQYTGMKTFFGKTALLLQSVEADLGNIHYVLVRVMFVLTTLSLALCIICFGYLMGHYKLSFKESLEFTVVLLVVSIPIAIEIVVTTTLALGSKELSIQKVIVTRLSAIEMMSAVNMLCSDKTGTLTLNKMEIQEKCHTFEPGQNRASVLVLAALAAKWREPPRDALDTMVLGAADLDECDKFTQLEFVPFDPRLKRTEATLRGPDGFVFKVTKGAPNIVMELCHNKAEIKEDVEKIITDLGERGIRCLTVARTKEDGKWHMAGILTFLDPPRPDTKETVRRSKEYGVDVKMITGDHQLIAKEMARMLDMDTNIMTSEGLPKFPESGDPKDIPLTLGDTHGEMMLNCGGFAHVYPEHKYLIVETLRQRGYTCAMTGDGVNDSPALKRADVGVAVHGATDAARAASDMVLTEPGLSVVVDAMLIARGVFQRMLSFLTYRVSATLQLVFFFFIGVFALPLEHYGIIDPEFQFFHLPVLMFMLITLLNDGTLMAIGYDNVVPSSRPQRWNLPVLFTVAAVLAGVACVSSLLLLWMAVDSIRVYDKSWFHGLGIAQVQPGQIVTMVYLKVSISDFLTLFSARTQSDFFWSYAPSKILSIGAVLSLTISTIVATFWPVDSPDGIKTIGLAHGDGNTNLLPIWVWLYCIFWWFVQDLTKVATYKILDRYDLFNYRTIAQGEWTVETARASQGKNSKKGKEQAEPLLREGKGYGSVN